MSYLNTRKGIIKFVNGRIITISLRRGGTIKTITDRKFKPGDVICFTVDPVHLNITNVMPKAEADSIVRRATIPEERIAHLDIPDGLIIPEIPDFGEEDPIDMYYGREEGETYDNINELRNTRLVSTEYADNGGRESGETLIDGCDYFGDTPGD